MKKIMLAVLMTGTLLMCSCNTQKEEAVQQEKSAQESVLQNEQAESTFTEQDKQADEAVHAEEIQKIIGGATWIIESESKQSVSLFDLSAVNDSYAGNPSRYAVSDIDEDGIPELVVEFSLTADISVIKKEADGWYAYLNLYDDSKLNDSIHAWLSF